MRFSLLAFVCITTAISAADSPQTVLDKAIVAMGGEEKLKKYQAESFSSKGKMTAGGMSIDYTAKYYVLRPNSLRFDMKMNFMGQDIEISAASNGNEAWEMAAGQQQDMPKDKAAEFNHTIYVMNLCQLVPLKQKDFDLKIIEGSKEGSTELIGLLVSRKEHRDVKLYFDAKSFTLLKVVTKVNDEFQNKEVTQELIFSEFREIDGLKYFDKMVMKRDGAIFLTETFSDQKPAENLDSKLFIKPKQ